MTILPSTPVLRTSPQDASDRTAPRRTSSIDAARAADRTMPFEASLAATAGQAAPAEAKVEAGPASAPISMVYRGSRSGELSPLQKFEGFALRTFVESMLPSDNSSFFGTGTAGGIWKSMLAERIGDEMAKAGGIGIADLIGKRGTQTPAAAEGAVRDLASREATAISAAAFDPAGKR